MKGGFISKALDWSLCSHFMGWFFSFLFFSSSIPLAVHFLFFFPFDSPPLLFLLFFPACPLSKKRGRAVMINELRYGTVPLYVRTYIRIYVYMYLNERGRLCYGGRKS